MVAFCARSSGHGGHTGKRMAPARLTRLTQCGRLSPLPPDIGRPRTLAKEKGRRSSIEVESTATRAVPITTATVT
jgi:hypothetical protein